MSYNLLLILVFITQLKRSVNKHTNTNTQTHTHNNTQTERENNDQPTDRPTEGDNRTTTTTGHRPRPPPDHQKNGKKFRRKFPKQDPHPQKTNHFPKRTSHRMTYNNPQPRHI